MNKTNDFKYNLPAYSDPVDIEDLNDNFRGIDDALMAGLCKKDYTGNNMGSSDPSARKYAWAPWLEIVNDNEFDVVVADRNAPVESEEATINIAAGQTFRKYINGRYYMNFYVQDQHDVTFKWFTNAETYINESGGGGGTGTVTSVSVQGGSGSHLTGSGNPIETSGTITINVDDGYSIPSDNEQTAWDGKAADLKAEIDSSTYVLTLQLKDSAGNLIGTAKTIDLPLETMVVDGEYDSQTKKIKLELKNGNYVEFSVADLVSGLQTELSASNKLDPDYIDYDSNHRAVSDTEKNTWNGKQNAIDSEHKLSSSLVSFTTAEAAAIASGIDSSKVAQISTNQSNILYGIKTGAKNQLKLTGTVYNPNTLYVYWDYENGTVRVTGSKATTSTVFIYLGSWTAPEDGVYRLYANAEACTANIRVFDDANWNTYTAGGDSNEATWTKGTTRTVYIRIASGVVVGDITVTPMICQKSVFDADPTFAPYSAPNSDLTYLEAEDRAALAEVVDSGAKNLIDCSVDNIKSLNSSSMYSWNGNTVTAYGRTATVNADKTITVAAGTGSAEFWLKVANYTYASGVSYVLSGCPTNGSTTTYYMESDNLNLRDIGSGVVINTATTDALYVVVKTTGSTPALTFKPMLCTKSQFNISPAYAPYTLPNYDLTYLESEDRASLAEVVDSGAKNLVDLADKTVTISGYAYNKTAIPALPKGNYACSIAKTNTIASMEIALWDSNNNEVGRFNPDDNYFTTTGTATKITIWVNLVGGSSSGTISNIMICTKAAFGVSKAFVPYRPNYDLVASHAMNSRYDIENGNRLAVSSTVDISSWSDGLYMITTLMAVDQQTRYGISVYVFNKFFDDIRLLTPLKEVTKATITGISVTDGVATITYSDNGYHMTSIARL